MELLIPIIQILIAFQCFIFAAFLALNQRLALTANRIMFLLLIVLAAHMVLNLVNQHLYIGIMPNFAIGLGYAYGPLLYLYTQSLTLENFRVSRKQMSHALPSIAVIISALSVEFPIQYYAYGIFFSLLVYYVLSHRKLKHYQMVLGQTRSNYDQIALKWLSWLLTLQIVLLLINVLSVQFYVMGLTIFGFWGEVGLFFALLILINTINLKGLTHPELFSGISLGDQKLVDQNGAGNTPTLSTIEADELLQALDKHMVQKQPFLNPSLTIRQVGLQITTNPRYVSQTINLLRGTNFSEYVNTYRVELVKKKLADPAEVDNSILDIMLDCGFNTKSNFNRSFKNNTGMTPLQYRRNL